MTDKLKNTIINYLNKEYSGHTLFETDKEKNYIYSIKDNQLIYRYNTKTKTIGVNYNEIWSFLDNFMGLTPEESREVLKEWINTRHDWEIFMVCSMNLGILSVM
jgi:hypothetical protein